MLEIVAEIVAVVAVTLELPDVTTVGASFMPVPVALTG